MVEKPETLEDYKECFNDFMELCNHLHKHNDLIPSKVWDEGLSDLVYKRFEP